MAPALKPRSSSVRQWLVVLVLSAILLALFGTFNLGRLVDSYGDRPVEQLSMEIAAPDPTPDVERQDAVYVATDPPTMPPPPSCNNTQLRNGSPATCDELEQTNHKLFNWKSAQATPGSTFCFSDTIASNCTFQDMSYASQNQLCASMGARLCSAAEVELVGRKPEDDKSGCLDWIVSDAKAMPLTWTSTSCAVGMAFMKAVTVQGRSRCYPVDVVQKSSPMCCADRFGPDTCKDVKDVKTNTLVPAPKCKVGETLVGSLRPCSDFPKWQVAKNNICHSSVLYNVCPKNAVLLATAIQMCSRQGARICSYDDVRQGMNRELDPSFVPPACDQRHRASVWTSTRCRTRDEDGNWVPGTMTTPNYYNAVDDTGSWMFQTCVPDDQLETRKARFMCCADVRSDPSPSCIAAADAPDQDVVDDPALEWDAQSSESFEDWSRDCAKVDSPLSCAATRMQREAFPTIPVDKVHSLTDYVDLLSGRCEPGYHCKPGSLGGGSYLEESADRSQGDPASVFHPQDCWLYKFAKAQDVAHCLSPGGNLAVVGDPFMYRLFACFKEQVTKQPTGCGNIDITFATTPPSDRFVVQSHDGLEITVEFHRHPRTDLATKQMLSYFASTCEGDQPSGCVRHVWVNAWGALSVADFLQTAVASKTFYTAKLATLASALGKFGANLLFFNAPISESAQGRLDQEDTTQRLAYNTLMTKSDVPVVDLMSPSLASPTQPFDASKDMFVSAAWIALNTVCHDRIVDGAVRSAGQVCTAGRCTSCNRVMSKIPHGRVNEAVSTMVRVSGGPTIVEGYVAQRWNYTWDELKRLGSDVKLNVRKEYATVASRKFQDILLPKYVDTVVLQNTDFVLKSGSKVPKKKLPWYAGNNKLSPAAANKLKLVKPHELLPKKRKVSNPHVWIGGAGTFSALHNDHANDGNFVFQYLGEKVFYMFHPKMEPHLDTKVINMVTWSNIPDPRYVKDLVAHNRFPYAASRQVDARIKQGDLLIVPKLWFHAVENTSPSLMGNCWMKMPKN